MSQNNIDSVIRIVGSIVDYLKELFIGKSKDIQVIMLALLSRQHCLILGPPGTAKSAILHKICKIIDAPYFEYLLTKFTTPEELFGPINIKQLREQGVMTYITTNKLPEAKLAFLDEIFKASSAILNALLTIINERKFYNGTKYIDVPIHSIFFASNELPEETELAAFYDRILFKHFSHYIKQEEWEEYLTQYIKLHIKEQELNSHAKINFQFLNNVDKIVTNLDYTPIKSEYLKILRKVADSNITISDRTRGRALLGIGANALYHKRKIIQPIDLYALSYIIPRTESEKNIVDQILLDIIGEEEKYIQSLEEIEMQLNGFFERIEQATEMNDLLEIINMLRRAREQYRLLKNHRSDDVKKLVDDLEAIDNKLSDKIKKKIEEITKIG